MKGVGCGYQLKALLVPRLQLSSSLHTGHAMRLHSCVQHRARYLVVGLVIHSRPLFINNNHAHHSSSLKGERDTSSTSHLISSHATTAASGTGTTSYVDFFALSRIMNYLHRATLAEHSCKGSADCIRVEQLGPNRFQCKLSLPVDVIGENTSSKGTPETKKEGKYTRTMIESCGVGPDAKAAKIACCMHAELCLDALGVPLFSSERRQQQRAEVARRNGRYAPLLHDPPRMLSRVVLPPAITVANTGPVADCRSITGVNTMKSLSQCPPANNRGGLRGGHQRVSQKRADRRYFSPVSRKKDYRQRFGVDAFLMDFNKELAGLQASILNAALGSFEVGEGGEGDRDSMNNDGTGGDDDGAVIDPRDVSILQARGPSISDGALFLQPYDEDTRPAIDASAVTLSRSRSLPVGVSFSFSLPSRNTEGATRTAHHQDDSLLMDEGEGGVFDLVENDDVAWLKDPGTPMASCLLDPHALTRVNSYLARTLHRTPRRMGSSSSSSSSANGYASEPATLANCARVSISQEDTPLPTFKRRSRKELRVWYTVSLVVPGITANCFAAQHNTVTSVAEEEEEGGKGFTCVGKAASIETAQMLCAMHAERALCFAGVPLLSDPEKQMRYYDGCLCWGICAAPEPRYNDGEVVTTKIAAPKPLKEWVKIYRFCRFRLTPLSLTETLLVLNRRTIADFRHHICEVDLYGSSLSSGALHQELLRRSLRCLRAYMVARHHPYERAVFIRVFVENSQYRASVFLPLPPRLGIRGAYAIGNTPQHARELCALHAMDILCTFDCIPPPTSAMDGVCCEGDRAQCQSNWKEMLELRRRLGLSLPPSYSIVQSTSADAADRIYVKKIDAGSQKAVESVHPNLRSPPAYREAPGSSPVSVPPLSEVWRVMLLDADAFDIARGDAEELIRSALTASAVPHVPFHQMLQRFFWTTMEHITSGVVSEDAKWVYQRHYIGEQHYKGRRRRYANNYWMQLPLNTAVYGERYVIGRCVLQKSAENMMLIHGLRTLRALGLAPWDTMPPSHLVKQIYRGDIATMKDDLKYWHTLCCILLDEGSESCDAAVITSSSSVYSEAGEGGVQEAQLVTSIPPPLSNQHRDQSLCDRACPHPVMSAQLALSTF